MQKCPNCGQGTQRTEDWACPWCGYPLLSGAYKKIPKTYQELQEEKVPKQKPPVPVIEEPELIPEPEEPEPEPTFEAEPVVEPELTLEPEPVLESELVTGAIEMTVEELLSAYETDWMAADAKFANKLLKVTGIVSRIEVKDIVDIHYITLTSAGNNILQNVRCMFDQKHGPELSQLTKGQTLTVQGIYDGSIINIRMRDCVLVH